MDLTEEQKQTMNNQVEQLPVIQELKKSDKEIMDKLTGLETGQEEIEERLDKGAKRMDGIEDKVDKLTEMIINSDRTRDQQHNDLKNEIRDDKLRELTGKLESEKLKNEKTDSRIWEILKIISALLIAAALGYLGIK